MTFDIASVGHYTQDTIVYTHSARVVDGGAFNYGANVAARMGLEVAVITRLARQDWHIRQDGKLTVDGWPGKEAILKYVTVLKTDAVEAELITGESDRNAAAKKLAEYGPKEVLLTHNGGVMVYHDGKFHQAPFVPQELRGCSGRGDTCTSAYLSRRYIPPPEDAIVWAAAVTSLKLETEGVFWREMVEVEVLYQRLRHNR